MKKNIILSITAIIALAFFGGIYNQAQSETAGVQKQAPKQAQKVQAKPQAKTQAPQPLKATSLEIVANPSKFLNKTVKMQATFDKFSTLGLDYKKAMRPSTDYIGILIQRDDVIDHDIPLSEMKLFLKKELAEKHIDLDTGDKIELTVKEFSTALNDPWLDVENLTVIKKAKKEEVQD